jgi:deazaflavin-dependent oxidoreductase (nitroreductase family)
MASWNDNIIEQFRANQGVVGGPFEGKQLTLLHTVGPRTGNAYVTPLVAAPDGDGAYVVCGSLGGAPTDPKWVGHLEAGSSPATIEVGADTVEADYQVVRAGDPEWERLWDVWRTYWPAANDYATKTDRKFPMIRLVVKS